MSYPQSALNHNASLPPSRLSVTAVSFSFFHRGCRLSEIMGNVRQWFEMKRVPAAIWLSFPFRDHRFDKKKCRKKKKKKREKASEQVVDKIWARFFGGLPPGFLLSSFVRAVYPPYNLTFLSTLPSLPYFHFLCFFLFSFTFSSFFLNKVRREAIKTFTTVTSHVSLDSLFPPPPPCTTDYNHLDNHPFHP